MSISSADLEAARRLDSTTRNEALADLSALPSVAATLAFVATQARAAGDGEADCVELVVRLCEETPDDVRASAAILAAMGYTAVAARLRQIAGRRHRTLKPLPDLEGATR